MQKSFILVLVCLCAFFAKAQKKTNPTSQDIQLAQSLKEKFDDEDVVVTNKKAFVSFTRDIKNQKVGVILKEETTFMNISESTRMQHGVFYDAESKVEKFEVRTRDGRITNAWVEDEYVSSADLFHTDYRVKYVELNFLLKGYMYTVTTVKKFEDIKYFTSSYFSDSYFIRNGKISVDVPEWLTLEIKEFNFGDHTIKKETVPIKKGEKVTFDYSDMAPRAKENNVPGPSYLYPHILFLAKSYTDKNGAYPLFNTVDDLYKWYNSLVKEVDVDPTEYKEVVAKLVTGALTEDEKIRRIYYWVQDNIRYVAFEDGIAGFKPDSPQNVFNKRYGDCKGMAFLTKAMLDEAGFDARLVWIGTDRLAYDYSTPSLSVDNHMICAVFKDNEYLFLDGTEKYNKMGDYASRIQNKEALVQDGENFSIQKIPTNKKGLNIDKTVYKFSIVDESLKGNVQKIYGGESRVSFQNNFYSFGKGDQKEVLGNYLSGGNNNYKVDNIEAFDARNREEAVHFSYDVEIEQAISSFDNTLYIDLDPIKRAEYWILKDRKVDLKLPLLEDETTTIELHIPEGYVVETLPASFESHNALVDVVLTYEEKQGKILFHKSVITKKRHLKLLDFEIWNEAFEGLKEANSQQLTLIRKS